MKNQIITVTNKAQLMVAVGIAIDFPGATEITLIHKTGKAFYTFAPLSDTYWSIVNYNRKLRKARSYIKTRIAAEHLK